MTDKPTAGIEQVAASGSDIVDEIQQAITADEEFLETILTGVLARGHVLLEVVPGHGENPDCTDVSNDTGVVVQSDPVHSGSAAE